MMPAHGIDRLLINAERKANEPELELLQMILGDSGYAKT